MIDIPQEVWDKVTLHCRNTFPEEACGFLAAMRDAPDVIVAVLPMFNVSDFAHARYEVDPREQLAAYHALHEVNQKVRITYHSHVNAGPELSATDIRYARDSSMLHLVCEVRTGSGVVGAALWQVEYRSGIPLPVRLDDWRVVG